jgi:hypothetical protein
MKCLDASTDLKAVIYQFVSCTSCQWHIEVQGTAMPVIQLNYPHLAYIVTEVLML